MPLRFSGGQSMHSLKPINPRQALTIESRLVLMKDGEAPTILALPFSAKWEAPYVVYRLGFKGSTRRPEFQVLIEGDSEPTSVLGPSPVARYELFHVGGTFDGKILRLYVNGEEVAQKEKAGRIATSQQPSVIGARSSTDHGGHIDALFHEIRIFNNARTPEEIKRWRFKNLTSPGGPTCVGLWQA
jgi:hypothetical protein